MMRLVLCPSCGTRNRLADYKLAKVPICGACHAELPEDADLKWLRRAYRLRWPLVAAVIASIALVVWNPINMHTGLASDTIKRAPLPVPHPVPADQKEIISPVPMPKALLMPLGPLSTFPADALPRVSVTLPDDQDGYLIVFKSYGSRSKGLRYMTFGGSHFTVHLDPGMYELAYASGRQWFGERLLFGPETKFFKAETPIVMSLRPVEDGIEYSNTSIILKKMVNGNLRTSAISEADFRSKF